jgi:porin
MMTKRTAMIAAVLLLLGTSLRTAARAEEPAADGPYSGGFFSRSTLTGDWGGARNDLAKKGVTLDLSLTQIGQGVTAGGKDSTWEYGGRENFTANLDTQKLGLWPGGFLTLEVEGNYADSVNGKTGAIMPVNSNQLYPEPTGNNLNVPQLSFAQFLSPYAGLVAGKLDTTSGDMNEFAHGKGDVQFLNLAFNFNAVPLVSTPYSTLGAGIIVLPTKDPAEAIVTFLVLQANGTASEPGFSDLSVNKLTFAGEGRVRTDFFGLTGHQLVGAGYSNKQFTSLDQRLSFGIDNRKFAKKDGSWDVYYNFDQYLYETDKGSGRGVGLFGRFGASDGNPNLFNYFYSAGVGGKGVIPYRENDRFGIGYYYIDITSPTFQGFLRTRSLLQDEWGFEAFYNVAITPWLLLTPDVQVIGPTQKRAFLTRERVATATVVGFRVQVVF